MVGPAASRVGTGLAGQTDGTVGLIAPFYPSPATPPIGWRYSASPRSACYEPNVPCSFLAYVRSPLVERAPAGHACCVARAFSRLPHRTGRSVSASFACLQPLT